VNNKKNVIKMSASFL